MLIVNVASGQQPKETKRVFILTKIILAIGLVVFLLLTPSLDPTLAQGGDAPLPSMLPTLRFTRLTTEQGLVSDSVFSIAQDKKGFMWFGTLDGLNRYDGYEFKAYKHDAEAPHSLSSDAIRKILVDDEGVLWVGTWIAGLCRFDSYTEQFTCYRHDPDDPGSLSDDAIREVFLDRDGVLWIGTQNQGLDRLDPETGQFAHYPHDSNAPHSLSDNHIEVMYQDREGVLWVGTHNGGLNRYDPATATDLSVGLFTHYRHDPNDPTSLGHNDVRTIFEDHTGTLWVGTWGGGLNKFDRETGTFVRYLHDPGDPQSVSDNNIRPIYEDRAGNLWIGTSGGGLNKFDRETETFAHYQHDAGDPYSLSHNHTRTLYEDRGGVLWVGTFGGGLNKYDRGAEKFTGLQLGVGALQGLPPNAVMSIWEGRGSVLWMGTDGGGLIRYDRATESAFQYQHDPAEASSLAQNNIWALFEDRMGVLWIGTESQGLDRFDLATGQFAHYQHDPADPNSLSNDGVYAIFEDRAGSLWIGTNGGGLNLLDRESGTFVRYLHDPADPKSLSHNNITVILEDQKGALWIGTWGGGVSRLDHGSRQFTRYQHDPEDPKSLSDDNVFAILEGREGDLWFGTGGGLSRLDRASGQFTRYTTQQGLSSNMVVGVLQDDILPDQGGSNLWLSTFGKISRFNLVTETFKVYDVSDGLKSETFSMSSYHKSRSGELFFGADNGIAAFYPEQIKDNPHIPPVVITSFFLANKPVPIGGESVLQRSILETDHLILSHLDRVLSFEFSALNYRSSEKNQYKYRLEGFDEDWNELSSKRRFATYTNLNPGEYEFRVIGSNNDGLWNEEGVAIQITITPPWWQTTWFRVFAGLSVMGLIAGAFVGQRQSAKRRERQLESQITERKEFEQQLVDAERKYRTVADFTHDWEYWTGPNGSMLYVSPSCEHITGYRPSDFVDRPELSESIILPEDLASWNAHSHGGVAGPAKSDCQFRIRTKDGTTRWIEHVCRPVYDEQGNYAGVRASNRDITNLRLAEQEARENQEILARLNRTVNLEQLAGSIAHELNQPLTGILSNAQAGEMLLKRGDGNRTEIEEILTDIIADGKRSGDILRNLRDHFGRQKSEFMLLGVNKMVEKTIRLLNSEFVIQRLNIRLVLSDTLPDVMGNKIQLQQVMINLLNNALQAMQNLAKADRSISIITERRNGGAVQVQVEDSGPGIDPEQLESIFDSLATSKRGGLGLGLSISRSIVQAHGGRIWAENITAGGARISFTLPAAEVQS